MVADGLRGFTFKVNDEDDLVAVLTSISKQQSKLPDMIMAGRDYAASQTLEAWALDYYKTVCHFYNL